MEFHNLRRRAFAMLSSFKIQSASEELQNAVAAETIKVFEKLWGVWRVSLLKNMNSSEKK